MAINREYGSWTRFYFRLFDYFAFVEVKAEYPGGLGKVFQRIERNILVHPQSQLGYKIFETDLKKFEKLKDEKMRLISKLLTCMEREVRDKVESQDGFRDACRRGDIIRVWQLTENTVRGQGSISVYSITLRLLK